MATIAIGNRTELAPQLLNAMHAFRHKIFIGRLGWSLPLVEEIERDKYDHEGTVYVMACDSDEQVTACARLLPTNGPYMLPELFPQLLGGLAAPNNPAIWELSRFATNVRATRDRRILALSQQTIELLDSVLAYARERGIERLALVTSIAIERLMLRVGLSAHRIASPAFVQGTLCVALFIEVSETGRHYADLH